MAGDPVTHITRNQKAIKQMQQGLDAIETEATRLMVYASSTRDVELGKRLKKIAEVIAKNVIAIQDQLVSSKKSH